MVTDIGLKYFRHAELACRKSGVVKLAEGFGNRIDDVREAWGKVLKVNSCCRSAGHNKAVGGHLKSLHVYDIPMHPTGGTCAIDFAFADGKEKGEFVKLAWSMGFSVGVNKGFIHIDDRTRVLGMNQALFAY